MEPLFTIFSIFHLLLVKKKIKKTLHSPTLHLASPPQAVRLRLRAHLITPGAKI
jgi:hypothetical protein